MENKGLIEESMMINIWFPSQSWIFEHLHFFDLVGLQVEHFEYFHIPRGSTVHLQASIQQC